MKITFIGSGNMGKAIMGGLIKAGICQPSEITAADPSDATRREVAETYGVNTKNDNVLAVKGADVVLLAVKPQVIAGVMEGIKEALTPDQLILSIAAGKTLAFLEQGLGSDKKIIRCMPNTPALVGEGMTEYAPGANITDKDKELARTILSAFGKCVELPEHLIDAAGAVAGCGPAYFYMMIEAMADGGVAEGVPRAVAYELAAQTMLGSAKMVLETGRHPGELKDMVTSPAGSTIEGVAELEDSGFRGAVMRSVRAAAARNREL